MDHQTVRHQTTCLKWRCTPENETSSMGIATCPHPSKQTPQTKACTVQVLQSTNTPGLWCHNRWPILFTLVVNGFSIKCLNKDNVQHLILSMKKDYTLNYDWSGDLNCGIHLEWDYTSSCIKAGKKSLSWSVLVARAFEYLIVFLIGSCI
jgi:hypothetical protein